MPDEEKKQPRENPREERPERGSNENLNEERLPDINHESWDEGFNKGKMPSNIEYIIRPPVSENPPSKED